MGTWRLFTLKPTDISTGHLPGGFYTGPKSFPASVEQSKVITAVMGELRTPQALSPSSGITLKTPL